MPSTSDNPSIFLHNVSAINVRYLTIPAKAPLRVVAKLHFRSPNQGSLFINIVVKAPEVADMTVFLIAVATVAPSPGFEMLTCDEPLKARKPKIRMNPPRAASYKENGIHNQIFTSTGYFLLSFL